MWQEQGILVSMADGVQSQEYHTDLIGCKPSTWSGFLSLCVVLCLTSCSPLPVVIAYNVGAAWYTGTHGTQQRPPKVQPVTATFEPDLTDNQTPVFPPVRLLVLRPVDQRPQPEVNEARGGELPETGGDSDIIGFLGISSEEGHIRIAPEDEIPDLGVRREMDSGMPHAPDIPRKVFTFQGLTTTVQEALTMHFRNAGIPAKPVSFSEQQSTLGATYALSCTVEDFSLFSLRRYQQVRRRTIGGSFLRDVPIRGPTRAAVSLKLALHHLPSGEIVWQESVWDIIHDPPQGESQHRFQEADALLTIALSRAVGSVLASNSLQAVLLPAPPQAGQEEEVAS